MLVKQHALWIVAPRVAQGLCSLHQVFCPQLAFTRHRRHGPPHNSWIATVACDADLNYHRVRRAANRTVVCWSPTKELWLGQKRYGHALVDKPDVARYCVSGHAVGVRTVEKLPSDCCCESSADFCRTTTDETVRVKRHDCVSRPTMKRFSSQKISKACRLTCLVVGVNTACHVSDIMCDCVATWSPRAKPGSGLGLSDADVPVGE